MHLRIEARSPVVLTAGQNKQKVSSEKVSSGNVSSENVSCLNPGDREEIERHLPKLEGNDCLARKLGRKSRSPIRFRCMGSAATGVCSGYLKSDSKEPVHTKMGTVVGFLGKNRTVRSEVGPSGRSDRTVRLKHCSAVMITYRVSCIRIWSLPDVL